MGNIIKKLHQFLYEVKLNLEQETAMKVERTYSVVGKYRNEIIFLQAQSDTVTVVIATQQLKVNGNGFYISLIISIAVIYASYCYYRKSSISAKANVSDTTFINEQRRNK